MNRKWLRAAAWVVTLGIIAYMLATIPIGRVLSALTDARPWAAPAIAVSVVLVFLADTLAAWRTFSWFAAPLSFHEALVIRGAAYPLSLINYAVGQGAFAYFLHQRRDVPILRSAATVLLIMGINVVLLMLIASIGVVVSGPLSPVLATQMKAVHGLLVLGYAGLAVYVAVVVWKPPFLARRAILDVLLSAGPGGYAKALAVRVPHVLSLVFFAYLYLRGFGIDVPLKEAFLFLPVAFLVVAIPLPGQGFGAAQLIMVAFFYPYAKGEPEMQKASVFAAGMTGQVIATVMQTAIGLVCLRSHLARGLTPGPGTPGPLPSQNPAVPS